MGGQNIEDYQDENGDTYYGPRDVLVLLKKDPDAALHNAENYAWNIAVNTSHF
jgi:hypothetical protein